MSLEYHFHSLFIIYKNTLISFREGYLSCCRRESIKLQRLCSCCHNHVTGPNEEESIENIKRGEIIGSARPVVLSFSNSVT